MFVDWTLSLIINLVAAVIFFILGIISKTIFDIVRKKNPVRNFWGECLTSPVNIIIPSVPEDYDEFSFHTGYSDMKASAKVSSLLSTFSNVSEGVKILEAKYAYDRLDENVVLIGGPITNEIIRRIIQDFDIPFSFTNHTLIDNYHNKKYEPKLGEDKNVLEDYAFILKIMNPFNNKKILVIIVGCWGYGSYSGSVAVTDYESLRIIRRRTKAKSIGIIVRSHIVHKIPQKPSIIEVFEIK